MTKRKRKEWSEQATDVGLGATLACLRAEDQPDASTAKATAADQDNEGWTVVGGSKRRRCDRDSRRRRRKYGSTSPRSRSRHGSPHAEAQEPDSTRLRNPSHADTKGEERGNLAGSDRPYPAIEHSHYARLLSHVKITDLQSLILYLLADGNAPQWISVRSRASIQQVVVVLVPGLELGMFSGEISFDADACDGERTRKNDQDVIDASLDATRPKLLSISPDDFYPVHLKPHRLPSPLKRLSDMFRHVWPIKAAGEQHSGQFVRLHSPIQTMLVTPIPKRREEKQMKKDGSHNGRLSQAHKHGSYQRTRISEYVIGLADQEENDYVPHPAWFTTEESKEAAHERRKSCKRDADHGWVDTQVMSLKEGEVDEDAIEQGSVTAGRHVLAVDCEMCKAEDDTLVLTRISVVEWSGRVVMDKLVKPGGAIKDYLTQWSGITADMLDPVTTTLAEIQDELEGLITPHTILVGHSLNSDLHALKLTHPFLVDTGLLFPHPRGPPYKQSLKWLAQKYLQREVQQGGQGHDSVEDARTCLDLVKQKCERGAGWGSGETKTESLFARLGRTKRPGGSEECRASAVIDWGDASRGHGGQAQVCIACETDEEVVQAVGRAAKGQEGRVDLIWARLRELELARGWWDGSKTAEGERMRQEAMQRLGSGADGQLGPTVWRTVEHIGRIYDSLPACTALLIYSGTGDGREMRRLQAMRQQFRREYATQHWDHLSVRWTDVEVQALSHACRHACHGLGLITVK